MMMAMENIHQRAEPGQVMDTEVDTMREAVVVVVETLTIDSKEIPEREGTEERVKVQEIISIIIEVELNTLLINILWNSTSYPQEQRKLVKKKQA